MTDDSNDQPRPTPRLELEPLRLRDTLRYVEQVPPPEPQPQGPQESFPVPKQPVHLCPNCDYNLTGLTSRRCPECGEPFNLRDARMAGLGLSSSMQELRRAIVVERIKLALGLAMGVAGLVAHHIGRPSKWIQLLVSASYGSLAALAIAVLAAIVVIYRRLDHGDVRGNTLLIIGAIVLAIGLWQVL